MASFLDSAGVTRLVTERASQAAVTQRAGRAGRQAPGIAYRLWEAAATAGMPAHDPAEVLESDLSGLMHAVIPAAIRRQKAFDLPAAVTALDRAAVADGQARVNASEALAAVPGVVALSSRYCALSTRANWAISDRSRHIRVK